MLWFGMGITHGGLSERGFYYTPLQHVMCQIGTKKENGKYGNNTL